MTVYFIRRQGDPKGLVKIGYAVILSQRLESIQTCMPEKIELLASMPGSIATEREIHKTLAAYRVSGEWFEPSAQMQEIIDAANVDGEPTAATIKPPRREMPTIEQASGSGSVVELTISYLAEMVWRDLGRRGGTMAKARDRVADTLGIPRTYAKRMWDRWHTMDDCSGNLYAAVSWHVAHILEPEGRLTPELKTTLQVGRFDGLKPPPGFRALPAPTGRLADPL